VPVEDFLLAQTPAEEDVLAVSARQEVDEAFVQVLDDPAELLDPLDAAGDAARLLLNVLLHLGELARREAAAVPGDVPEQLGVLLLGPLERPPVRHHPFGKGLHAWKRGIGLLEREIAVFRHAGTLTASRSGGFQGGGASMCRMNTKAILLLPAVLGAGLLAGCGSSSKTAATPPPPPPPPTAQTSTTSTQTQTSASPGALQAEANAAATGDIPDNQVFLTFHNATAGWSMQYPEGWAQSGSGDKLAFRDKNNIVRVVVTKGAAPNASAIRSKLKGVQITSGPQSMKISGANATKVVYTTQSAPNSVTGKRVTLIVDRYYLTHGAKEAIVDLGTPQGVDNVDAYRRMIESFKWK
jgi:hypothetical protein